MQLNSLASPVPVSAAVLIIGNEILSGRIRDANLQTLALWLTSQNIVLKEARVVADETDAIIAALNALRGRYTHVFTTGGIGPTHDDITAAAVAEAFGLPLHRHPEAVRRLEAYYPPGALNEARLRMATIPEGATLIDNPISAAPGFRIGNVCVLAGVPDIMRAMLDGLAGRLSGGPPIHARTVACRLPEGQIAEALAAIQARYPSVQIGSYPYFRGGTLGTSLVLRGFDGSLVEEAAANVHAMAQSFGDTPILSVGEAG